MQIESLFEPENIVSIDGVLPPSVTSLTSDSRQVEAGGAFFAIPGTKVDGASLVPEVLKKNVRVVFSESKFPIHPSTLFVRVKNARRAYAYALAKWEGSPSSRFKLIGVTGTNGKTTSTFLIHQAIRRMGQASGLIGTTGIFINEQELSSDLTTPGPRELQSLFSKMAKANLETVSMEVSSIALDQFRPWGSRFHLGLFTNLTQDHLDYHGDFEKYFAAKLRFFKDYSLPVAIINLDDRYGARLSRECTSPRVVTFGVESEKLDVRAEQIRLSDQGLLFEVVAKEYSLTLSSPLIGRFNVYNLLGVFAALCELSVKPEDAAKFLATASGAPGRLERVKTSTAGPSVFVDYAHSPDALAKVLEVVKEVAAQSGGRVLTVFGCGGDRDRTKRPQMAQIAEKWSDVIFVTSDNPRTENPEMILDEIEAGFSPGCPKYFREVNRRKAIQMVLADAKSNDIVLVAGKGHETYQIIGTEKFPFDDREVVRSCYS